MTDSPEKQANMNALISMLDETDTELYQTLKEALFSFGEEALPYLENARTQKTAPLWQNRLEALSRELRVEIACKKLSAWKQESHPDLLQGFYFLSAAFYPDLQWEYVRAEFNRMHGDCWLLLAASSGLKEKVVLLNNFFFNHCKFRLGKKIISGYSFADFFLPNLLNLKQGNDRALALAYQYLAERNRIPVFPLNLPVVNLLACTTDISMRSKADIRFCLDITQHGALINREDVEPVLSEQKQIRLCNTVEALQDYVKLLHFMTAMNETDPFRKQAAQKLHLCLGSSPGSMDPFFRNTPFSDGGAVI